MINFKEISLKNLAGFIAEELRKNDIDSILVGGACVTIYSNNQYMSYDLDFITYEDMKKVKNILSNIGFVKKQKYYVHEDCKWFIEFVSPPVAVGNEPISKFNQVNTPLGNIKLLRPEDCVKDRLASYYHWKDLQGLEQAITLCKSQKINLKEIERWSYQEDQAEKFHLFKAKLKAKKI